jgi:hypothetical protein
MAVVRIPPRSPLLTLSWALTPLVVRAAAVDGARLAALVSSASLLPSGTPDARVNRSKL